MGVADFFHDVGQRAQGAVHLTGQLAHKGYEFSGARAVSHELQKTPARVGAFVDSIGAGVAGVINAPANAASAATQALTDLSVGLRDIGKGAGKALDGAGSGLESVGRWLPLILVVGLVIFLVVAAQRGRSVLG